jgi:hypothetical protein
VGPEVTCTTCAVEWAPGPDDPDPAWRVPAGGPALWAKVLRRYDQEPRHRSFVEFCARSGARGYAARRYRRALERSGGRDLQAIEALDRLEGLAVDAMTPRRREQGPEGTLKVVLAVLITLALLAAVALLMVRLGSLSP